MEESFEKRLEENNFKKIDLNLFHSEPHVFLYLCIPIDSGDGQIRLKFGNDQIISVPGTLDENVRFLLWPTWKYPEDDPEYYVDDYGLYEGEMHCCLEVVPAAAWTDEEQIIDVKRFITDKGYIFKEYDTDEWKRASQKDLFKYYEDIRKNGLFNYNIEVSNEVVTSEFMELYFFRGALGMENLNIAHISGRIWTNKPYACPYDSEMFKMATSITEERNEFTLDDLALLMENYLSLYIYAENAVIILRNENYNRVTLDVCMFLENAEYQCTRTIYNRRGKNVKNICSFISEIIKCKSFQECMDTQYKAEAQGIIPAKRRKKMNRTDNTTDNTNHSQKSIVDCVYEIDDLGEFLRTHRVVCPIYYISGSICNEIPKESEKYKEIKKYIDSKLDMKRGCTYSAIIKIVWAAIYNAYSSMHWDELSLKFKEPLKRATIILNTDDSIKENIECFKKQAIAYFDAHDDSIPVSQRKFTMNYIWNNIDECESLDEIKTLAGSFFTVQYVAPCLKDEEEKG